MVVYCDDNDSEGVQKVFSDRKGKEGGQRCGLSIDSDVDSVRVPLFNEMSDGDV